MKKVSELGLEVIELEDQVLLVDNLNPKPGGYLFDNGEIYGPFEANDPLIDYKGNIITSIKPLEGLPLLVIEDDVEEIAWDYTEGNTKSKWAPIVRNAVVYGYNKAKETYKFTEEDLRKAFEAGSNFKEKNFKEVHLTDSNIVLKEPDFNKYSESLTKKELWIEVEEKHFRTVKNNEGQVIDHQFTIEPKITNNQIKAVWK